MDITDILGHQGKILGSKGQYRWDHKSHVVVFNSNVCCKSKGKIWHGDLDITVDEEKLMLAAKTLNERLYVLYETDARFENEKDPLYDRAVYSVDPSGDDAWNEDYYVRSENGRLYEQEPEEPTAEELERRRLDYVQGDFCKEEKYEKTSHKIPWGKITRLSSKKNPIEKFWIEVAKSLNVSMESEGDEEREKAKAVLSKVLISQKDLTQLKSATKAWVEKYYDFLSDYRQKSEVDMGIFLAGPDYMLYDPDWIMPGLLYLKKEKV